MLFTPFLRRVLLFDVATCVLMGIVLLAAGGVLEQLLGIPSALSYAAGVVLLVFAAAVAVAVIAELQVMGLRRGRQHAVPQARG